MNHLPNRGPIRPKFSSMPRQQSEAAAFLNRYKLTIERTRLQQELDSLNQRRDQILQRLAAIDQAVEHLDAQGRQWRTNYVKGDRSHASTAARNRQNAGSAQQSSDIKTLFVDY